MLCDCGRVHAANVAKTIRCKCGASMQLDVPAPLPLPILDLVQSRRAACASCAENENGLCLALTQQGKPGVIEPGIKMPDARCPLKKWGFWPGDGVGFLVTAHLKTGGTEVWHRTLLPRLDTVSGLVVTNPEMATGDPAKLGGCQFGAGPKAARRLIDACHTLVVWGIGNQLGSLLASAKNRPRVISVSHCDHRSDWTRQYMADQARWTDQCVYICPTGIQTVPASHRETAVLIPNAVDPLRLQPSRAKDVIRKELGIDAGDHVCLVVSRITPEKRIHLLCEAMQHLPSHYRLLIAGPPNKFEPDYYSSIAQASEASNGRIKLLDPIEHPGDLLSIASHALSASSYEGYGLSMAEAIHAGVPLIATATGLLETFPGAAKIVPMSETAKQWAAAILEDDPTSRIQAAKQLLQEHHSVDQFVAKWSELLAVFHPGNLPGSEPVILS